MATAVIRTGGKQYRVTEGDVLRVATLQGEPGDAVTFDEVLSLAADSAAPKFGAPTVKNAKVSAEIVNHGLGEKLIVFKFRKRKRYHKKSGHRQAYTAVKITGING
jgi:large subunit ribosomal protein L21